MAVNRALVFRAGSNGRICAAYEVAIEDGSPRKPGRMRVIRHCTNPATVTWKGTGLCAGCRDLLQHADIGVVRGIQRP